MKRFVDGVETTFSEQSASVGIGTDRLYVHTVDGVFSAAVVKRGEETLVSYKGRQYVVSSKLPRVRTTAVGDGQLIAPMPGQIVDLLVAVGDTVSKGQKLLVLEAMKTQQPFTAPFDGVVGDLRVEKGMQVVEGALLVRIEKPDASSGSAQVG